MQSSGDIVNLDLGRPEGREADHLHPAVVVTAQRILDAAPTVIQVVPLTNTLRGFHTEVVSYDNPMIIAGRVAVAAFIAGCTDPTRRSSATDLRIFAGRTPGPLYGSVGVFGCSGLPLAVGLLFERVAQCRFLDVVDEVVEIVDLLVLGTHR
jgi:mRNA-degrading endonuclease toxin of MazEF toxin-antitoxin module